MACLRWKRNERKRMSHVVCIILSASKCELSLWNLQLFLKFKGFLLSAKAEADKAAECCRWLTKAVTFSRIGAIWQWIRCNALRHRAQHSNTRENVRNAMAPPVKPECLIENSNLHEDKNPSPQVFKKPPIKEFNMYHYPSFYWIKSGRMWTWCKAKFVKYFKDILKPLNLDPNPFVFLPGCPFLAPSRTTSSQL